MTQREIKGLLKMEGAVDITEDKTPDYKARLEEEGDFDCISISYGNCGMNAGAWKGKNTGSIYVCTKRSPAMWLYTKW